MTARPCVIAHRGASGYLPEHTLEAKALAFGMGADYIEQDIVATRDSEVIVLHDTFLDDVTNVADVFPGRQRDDGHFYAIDFDLAEVRALSVHERRRAGTREALFAGRFQSPGLRFRVPTLGEEIELVQGLNRSMGKAVGLYAEIKEPAWHRRHGVDLAQLVLRELERYGYRHADDRIFVQCFDAPELRRIRNDLRCELKLVQLLSPRREGTLGSVRWPEIAEYAVAVGLPFGELVETRPGNPIAAPLVRALRNAGLAAHPYTFRREQVPPWMSSFEDLLAFFMNEVRVEALFCDQPDAAVAVRDKPLGHGKGPP